MNRIHLLNRAIHDPKKSFPSVNDFTAKSVNQDTSTPSLRYNHSLWWFTTCERYLTVSGPTVQLCCLHIHKGKQIIESNCGTSYLISKNEKCLKFIFY